MMECYQMELMLWVLPFRIPIGLFTITMMLEKYTESDTGKLG